MTKAPATSAHVLMIVTSHADLGQTGAKTGLWMEELAAPYRLFRAAGFKITIASPQGGAAPVDPGSLAEGFATEDVAGFQGDAEAMAQLADTRTLASITALKDYDALFLVGGHGTMWDFFPNADLTRLLAEAGRRGTVVGAVCHGVAALLNPGDDPAARHRLSGLRLTGFSNAEESAVGLTDAVPFLLESELRAHAALYESGPAFGPHVIQDGRYFTGQNPASSRDLADAMVRDLRR